MDPLDVELEYDPGQHRWLQIRHAGGVSFFEASADGASFETLAQLETPFDLSTGWVGVLATGWLNPGDVELSAEINAFELEYLCGPEG